MSVAVPLQVKPVVFVLFVQNSYICGFIFAEHVAITSASRNLVGGSGFEPLKSLTADLQSAPFGHLGNLPYMSFWSWWTDSNPRPADYKSAALPTELHQRICFVITMLL